VYNELERTGEEEVVVANFKLPFWFSPEITE
jgi:hypothetical protein